jgi:predicted RecA/RadA family phage recombinase
MKNFIQPGQYGLTVIAPTGGVTAGQVVIVGAIVGIAACTAAAGAEVEISPEGVFDLAKTPADALPAGAVAKVTPASGLVGLAGTAAIGWVVAAAASGAATARVRLVPSIAGTPTVEDAVSGTHTHQPEHAGGKRTRE